MANSKQTHDVISTLCDLVAINSINPHWGGPGEAEIADYIQHFFDRSGICCWTSEVLPGRPNVYVRIPGTRRDRRLIFEAHMDTVGVASMRIEPFAAELRNASLYARGACDVKGAMAAMMHAIRDVHESGIVPACDVWFAAVVDEEYLFRGVLALIDELKCDTPSADDIAIVAEPTQCRIATANKGVLRWDIVTHGLAAHSSKPQLGVNAISQMARVIHTLESDSQRISERSHPLVGSPTLCISLIQGGSQINFVPDQCRVSLDRRMIPGEQPDQVLADYRQLLDSLPELSFEMQPPELADEAGETEPTAPVATTARQVAERLGLDHQPIGVPFGCDFTKLNRAGVSSIIFGPGNIDQAHADVEFVEISQIESATRFYRHFILEHLK